MRDTGGRFFCVVVPPHDAEALAAAMGKMMALPEVERQAMGQAGRAHIEANYSLTAWTG